MDRFGSHPGFEAMNMESSISRNPSWRRPRLATEALTCAMLLFSLVTPLCLLLWLLLRSRIFSGSHDNSTSLVPVEHGVSAATHDTVPAGAVSINTKAYVESIAALFQILVPLNSSASLLYNGSVLLGGFDWTNRVYTALLSEFPCDRGREAISEVRVCAWIPERYAPNPNLAGDVPSLTKNKMRLEHSAGVFYLPRRPSHSGSWPQAAKFALVHAVALGATQRRKGSSFERGMCAAFESVLPSLGLNGIIEVVNGYSRRPDTYQDVIPMDLPHLLGAFAARKAKTLGLGPAAPASAAALQLLDTLPSQYLQEEDFAIVHSVTWSSLLLYFLPVGGEHHVDPDDFWDFILNDLCTPYGQLPADTGSSHCFHGVGHGAMFLASTFVSAEARELLRAGPCRYERRLGVSPDPESSIVFTAPMLDAALKLCGGAPSVEMRYMCGSGLYMTFWTSRFKQGGFARQPGGFDFASSCAGLPWSATCYRWTFRYATSAEVVAFRRDKDPCKAAAEEGRLAGADLRGCVWGLMTSWFSPVFDGYADIYSCSERSGCAPRYPFIAEFCGDFISNASDADDAKTWLSCIAGAVEAIAYRSNAMYSEDVQLAFCRTLREHLVRRLDLVGGGDGGILRRLGNRTAELCFQILRLPYDRVLYRDYDTQARPLFPTPCTAQSDLCLHGWRSDVLE